MATNPAEKFIRFISDPFGAGSEISDSAGRVLGTDNEEEIKRAVDTLSDVLGYGQNVSRENKGLFQDYLGAMQGLYGDGVSKFDSAVDQLADAIANRGSFSYDKDVSDFFDPAANQRRMAAMEAIENAGASGGNRFSSNFLDKQAAKQQALASEEWAKSYERLMQDRAQQLQEWQTGQQNIQNQATLAGLYGQDKNALGQAVGDFYSNMANQNNADLQLMGDIAGNKAEIETSRTKGIMPVAGGIGSLFKGIFA